MGRRIRRTIRRVDRSLRDAVGAVPIVGDVVGATGIVETPAMKQAKREEEMQKQQQALIEQQRQEQQAEEEWQKEQSQISGAIQGTQLGRNNYDFSNALMDNSLKSESDKDEDILKRLIKKR